MNDLDHLYVGLTVLLLRKTDPWSRATAHLWLGLLRATPNLISLVVCVSDEAWLTVEARAVIIIHSGLEDPLPITALTEVRRTARPHLDKLRVKLRVKGCVKLRVKGRVKIRFKGRILRLFSRWSDAMQRDRDGAFLAQLIAAQSDRSSHDDNDPFAPAGSCASPPSI